MAGTPHGLSGLNSNRLAPWFMALSIRSHPWLALVVTIAVAGLAFTGYSAARHFAAPRDLPPGVTAVRYARAARAFEIEFGRKPDQADTLRWLGEWAAGERDLPTALACFERISSDHARQGHTARYQQGQVLLNLDRAAAAESQLREFLELERQAPQETAAHRVDARQRLRYLLEVQLRLEERRELLGEMIERNEGDAFDDMTFCFPTLLRWHGENAAAKLNDFLKKDPANLNLRVARARYLTAQGRLDDAQAILEECCAGQPGHLPAWAALLDCLRERNQWAAMAEVVDRLPAAADGEPWLLSRLRGHVANDQKCYSDAIAHFERVLKADPACAECYLGIASACALLNEGKRRSQALRVAIVLARIQNRLGAVEADLTSPEMFVEIAEMCANIDLIAQARIMARRALILQPGNSRAQAVHDRLRSVAPPVGIK